MLLRIEQGRSGRAIGHGEAFAIRIGLLAELALHETVQRIDTEFRGVNAVLVALTSLARRQDRERSRAAGFAAHLVKPIGLGRLRAVLSELEPG